MVESGVIETDLNAEEQLCSPWLPFLIFDQEFRESYHSLELSFVGRQFQKVEKVISIDEPGAVPQAKEENPAHQTFGVDKDGVCFFPIERPSRVNR